VFAASHFKETHLPVNVHRFDRAGFGAAFISIKAIYHSFEPQPGLDQVVDYLTQRSSTLVTTVAPFLLNFKALLAEGSSAAVSLEHVIREIVTFVASRSIVRIYRLKT